MSTSEVIAERAISLVRDGTDTDAAVVDLRDKSLGRRVAVVMAKQHLDENGADPTEIQAAHELLDLTLERSDWAE
jgi:hypothetical protein